MSFVADVPRLECSVTALARHAISPGSRHVGVDVVDIDDFSRQLDAGGQRLAARWFTTAELAFCAGERDRLAATLAGKEAVAKVLGTGMRGGVRWRQIEILRRSDGAPLARLGGAARERADELAISHIAVSLCHESSVAMAVASGAPAKSRR